MSDQYAQSLDNLTVYVDSQAMLLPVNDLFYVESVDLNTFVYAEKAAYQNRQKLYKIEETLNNSHFLRISKQVIVNIRKIKSVSPAGEGVFR